MTITDAAVDAAAKAIYLRHGGIDWAAESESIHGLFKRDAREALEAALPSVVLGEVKAAALREAADWLRSATQSASPNTQASAVAPISGVSWTATDRVESWLRERAVQLSETHGGHHA